MTDTEGRRNNYHNKKKNFPKKKKKRNIFNHTDVITGLMKTVVYLPPALKERVLLETEKRSESTTIPFVSASPFFTINLCRLIEREGVSRD
jgi:hypothetical protein